MKLRNKKTGEIIDFEELNGYSLYDCGDKIVLGKNSEEPVYGYFTLKEFNEDWEDYNSKGPLIKDEKIRKAVRAWAEASDIEAVYLSSEALCWIEGFAKIEFAGNRDWYKELEEDKRYTITELCGEEEECES